MKIHGLSALILLSLSLYACGGSGSTTSTGPTVTTGPTIIVGPTVTAVSPDAGLAAGGTTVTVTGSNFKAGVSVKFGAILSSTVNVTSATTLIAISPAGNVGKVDVTVSDGTATSVTSNADQFNYMAFAEYVTLTAGSGPSAITAGPDGNLWFTERNVNKIGRITPGGTVTEYAIPTANSFLSAITAGPDGNLWFTERNINKIGRITPGGTVTEYATPTANSGPGGITAGPDGNLWFTEVDTNKIGVLRR